MRAVLLCLLGLYKTFLSPLLPTACRFAPTCSDYARDAVASHGALKGSLLAIRRVLRCHPWGKAGLDPVPCRHAPERPHE
jgi:putative membrane protein insertion efficiency factor